MLNDRHPRRALRQAVIGGTELRLVVTTQQVSRMLSPSDVDGLVCIYLSREAATTAGAPAAVSREAVT